MIKKWIICLVGIGTTVCAAAQGVLVAQNPASLMDYVQKQADIQYFRHIQAAELGLSEVKTTWKRCQEYTFRVRGKAGKGKFLINCQIVESRCHAVVQEGKIFVPSACFYTTAGKDEVNSLQKSTLLSKDTETPLQVLFKVKDFVILKSSR